MGWLLPVGIALSAGAQLWGAANQNKTNKQNQKAVAARNKQAEGIILPMLSGNQAGGGMSAGEKMLMEYLQGMDFGQVFGNNQAWNTGQDALMQFLREDPYDNTEMFKSWEPIEKRAMDTALADSFSQASGLGQRFGSAMFREEGRVRGEGAENAAARRQTAEAGAYEANKGRQMQAATGLGEMGGTQAQAFLQFMAQQLGGMQGLGNLGAQRTNSDAQLLSLLFGQPLAGSQANALPGAGANISNMLMLLPMLMQLSGKGN